MSEGNVEVNPASKRHWLYGFNAGVLVLVGIVVLGLIQVIFQNTRDSNWSQFDWSSGGVNSLSGSTKTLLKEITDKKQDYTILSLFTGPSDEEKRNGDPNHKAEQRRQVNDLLQSYARECSNIKVEDDGDVAREDVERRVRAKYQDEFKPYQKAVEDFGPLATKLGDFMKGEAQAIAANAQKPGTPAAEARVAASLQASFNQISDELDAGSREIRRATDTLLPQWSTITDAIHNDVIDKDIAPMFTLLSDPAKMKEIPNFPPSLLAYFTAANAKYKAMADQVKAYQDELTKLEPLKVQDVLSGIGRDTLVVLGPDSAKVIASSDIYHTPPAQADTATGQAPTDFRGEEAISSVLLAMTNPNKVKVVFVTAAPEHLTDDMYSDMRDSLEKMNFEVSEWSPPGPSSPDAPPPPTTPPAEGRGVVWIVFPPSPPSDQMMMMGGGMPNPQPVIDATRKHLAEGGSALFIAESSGGNSMAALMSGGGGYPYQELVTPFGIDVKSKYSVVHQVEVEDPSSGDRVATLARYWTVDHFPDTEITRPIQSLPVVFFPAQSVTVVDAQKSPPPGVAVQVLVRTPSSSDYWGTTGSSPTAKFDPASDLRAPVPVAAAAIRDKGQKDKEQRVVVIGSRYIGANTILDAGQAVLVGGQLQWEYFFPGNEQFMRNCVLWTAGYENMISVSSKANLAGRITGVSPGQMSVVRGGVIVGIPLLVLAIAGLTLFVRRR